MSDSLTRPEEAQSRAPGTEDAASQIPIPQWEPATVENDPGPLNDSIPEPESGSMKSQEESNATPRVSQRTFLDDALGGFDPRVHAVDDSGNPIKTKSGEFARKRGRKKGTFSHVENGDVSRETETPSETSAPKEDAQGGPQVTTQKIVMATTKGSKEVAKMVAAIFVVSTSKIIGDEWKPDDKAEMKMLEEATENYLNAIGGVEMSPGIGMLCAYGMYSLARMGHENTQSKTSKFLNWTKAKMVRAYLWVRGR